MAVKFIKKGKEAKEALKKAEAQAELDRQLRQGVQRFWLKPDTERQITFIDGELDEDGLIDMPLLEQHTVQIGSRWENFVCVADEEPCPICEMEIKGKPCVPSLVGILTVIDHTEWVDRNDEVHKDERKLFVMTRVTQKLLQKVATKRGGLAGVTFDVARSNGNKVPRVGDLFDFVEKRTHKQLVEEYGKETATPFDYEEVIPYHTADELRALGFGSGSTPIGASDTGKGSDYSDDL